MLTHSQRARARSYLEMVCDSLLVANYVAADLRESHNKLAKEYLQKAVHEMGFDLVPRAAEKLEAAE